MASLTLTRCGLLDPNLAVAVRHAIAVVATPALVVLDDVHLRLGIAYTATGTVLVAERPTCRWALLVRDLFFFDHPLNIAHSRPGGNAVRPVWSPDRRLIRRALAAADDDAFAALRRLVAYAACFLMAEESKLRDRIEIAATVYPRRPRPFALVPSSAYEELWAVDRSVRELLDRAEQRDLLADLMTRPPCLNTGRVRIAWVR